MKQSLLAIALTVTSATAYAAPIYTDGWMDWYDPTGALITIPGPGSGFVDQAAGTWGWATDAGGFYGLSWAFHSGTLYSPGSYAIDTVEGSPMYATIGDNQYGGHILIDWGATENIDMFVVWDINTDGSLSYSAPSIGMTDGPFPGFIGVIDFYSPSLISSVPVPANVWLFGSGLLGLIRIARRKKMA